MLTPVEQHFLSRAWGWTKQAFALAKRVATLEARVTALEETLGKQPADSCPKCGERAMRRARPGRILGGPPDQWRQDVWKCEKCGDEEVRIIHFS
jgi:ribosomal protein L37AE/L43A